MAITQAPGATQRESCDVVVIGGGPAGSAAALRFARQGRHVIQLERRRFHAPGCDRWHSGEGLPPASQREITSLGIDSRAADWATNTIRRLAVRWPSGRMTQDAFPRGRTIRMVERESLDAALFAAARGAGVDGREGWSVHRLLQDRRGMFNGVLATQSGDAATHITARLVIDAGGRNARSITQLGLRQPMGGPQFFVVTLFMDHVAHLEAERWEMHLFGDPLSILQITPLAPDVVGCGLGAPLRCRQSGQSPESFFWDQVAQDDRLMCRLREAHQIQAPWARANLAYRVRRLALPGLMVIGDASGYISPLLGDGVWSALRSAAIAADIGEAALRAGDVSESRLAGYSRRWTAARRVRVLINRVMVHSVEYPRLLEAGGARPPARRLFLSGLLSG